ncbi:MAG TPA: hypothetical protein VF676_00665 [Flavobacterium sp.]|jgi:YbbR domain-containing protein
MAEIKIEKKKPVWPWIVLILVLVLAALLYLWMQGNDDDNEGQITTIENTDTSAVLPTHGSTTFTIHHL